MAGKEFFLISITPVVKTPRPTINIIIRNIFLVGVTELAFTPKKLIRANIYRNECNQTIRIINLKNS